MRRTIVYNYIPMSLCILFLTAIKICNPFCEFNPVLVDAVKLHSPKGLTPDYLVQRKLMMVDWWLMYDSYKLYEPLTKSPSAVLLMPSLQPLAQVTGYSLVDSRISL